MAIRSRAVRPDAVLETAIGAIPHVSDQAFVNAVVDAATAMAMVGGELRIVVQRVPTEFANESLTAAALIEWRNHTEAKPQPEPHVGRADVMRNGERVGTVEVDLDDAGYPIADTAREIEDDLGEGIDDGDPDASEVEDLTAAR